MPYIIWSKKIEEIASATKNNFAAIAILLLLLFCCYCYFAIAVIFDQKNGK